MVDLSIAMLVYQRVPFEVSGEQVALQSLVLVLAKKWQKTMTDDEFGVCLKMLCTPKPNG